MRLKGRIANLLKQRGHTDAQAVCANPQTDPQLLTELIHIARRFPDPLGPAVASNPAVPIDALEALLRLYAKTVTENPAFRLRMAVDPTYLAALHPRMQAAIARAEDVDPRLIRRLAGTRNRPAFVRCAAARNPTCPADLMRDFATGRHAKSVRLALAFNRSLPSTLIATLARDPDLSVRETIAHRRDIPLGVLTRMIGPEEHDRVLVAVVRNRRTPKGVLDRLLQCGSPAVRDAVLQRYARYAPLQQRGLRLPPPPPETSR